MGGGVTPIKPSVMLASLSCDVSITYKRTYCGHFAGIVKMLKANALSVVNSHAVMHAHTVLRCKPPPFA